jgi:hypothetical protein
MACHCTVLNLHLLDCISSSYKLVPPSYSVLHLRPSPPEVSYISARTGYLRSPIPIALHANHRDMEPLYYGLES